jgi:pyruvate dehydrogenase E1 component alpha subunit
MELSTEALMDMHRRMVRIRLFEEAAGQLAEAAKLPGFLHLYVGQEAVAAGVCATLSDGDQITSTHRGHGHLVAKGGQFNEMMAELMGKATGYCKGRGGSMHISNLDVGMLGANGIVGAGVPISAGAALSARMSGTDRVSVTFFGDGAINQGAFYEACNLAAVWSLPLILICENNLYSEMTPIRDAVKNLDLGARAKALGIASKVVDGNDVEAMYQVTADAVAHARAGEGPTFIEAQTYRLQGHMYGDPETYRTKEEVQRWRANDPILRTRERALSRGMATPDQLDALETRTVAKIALAAQTARKGAEPDPVLIFTDVV